MSPSAKYRSLLAATAGAVRRPSRRTGVFAACLDNEQHHQRGNDNGDDQRQPTGPGMRTSLRRVRL
jgi:hypothetical protein